jgi:signal transduction histidine kinase
MEAGLRAKHPVASTVIAVGGLIPVLVLTALGVDQRILDPLTLVLIAGVAVSNVTDVRYEGRLWVSGSFLCCLLGAAVLGPSAGAVIALSGEILAWVWSRFALTALAINCVGTVAPTWASGVALAAIAPYSGSQGLDFDLALALIACADLAVNIAIVSSLMALHEELPLFGHVAAYRRLLPFLGANVVLLVAVTEAYRRVGIVAATFLIVVMLVFTYVVRLLVDARDRVNEIAKLSISQGRLAAEAVNADERARRELATELHDDALQALLAARQDLEEAKEGNPESAARAEKAVRETVSKLRNAVFELHPAVLEHAGLEAAVRAVANDHAQRAGFECHVVFDSNASHINDHLLFSLVRELVTNAGRHASPTNVWIVVERQQSDVEMSVRDDGRGFRPVELDRAIRTGHIGLASTRERAEALGGSFEVRTAPAAGTAVCIRLPVAALERARIVVAERATPAARDA